MSALRDLQQFAREWLEDQGMDYDPSCHPEMNTSISSSAISFMFSISFHFYILNGAHSWAAHAFAMQWRRFQPLCQLMGSSA